MTEGTSFSCLLLQNDKGCVGFFGLFRMTFFCKSLGARLDSSLREASPRSVQNDRRRAGFFASLRMTIGCSNAKHSNLRDGWQKNVPTGTGFFSRSLRSLLQNDRGNECWCSLLQNDNEKECFAHSFRMTECVCHSERAHLLLSF